MVLPWEQNRWVVPNLLQAPGANLKTIAVHYSCQNLVLLKAVEFITWKPGSYVQPWVNQAQLIMHQAFIRLCRYTFSSLLLPHSRPAFRRHGKVAVGAVKER